MSAFEFSFSDDFEQLVRKQPNSPAFILKHDLQPSEITFLELNRLINRTVSFYLEERGLQPGDTVAALLPNSAEMIVAFLASIRAGLRFAPIACTATPHEIRRWIGMVNPGLTLATGLLTGQALTAASDSGPEPAMFEPDGSYSWLPQDGQAEWSQTRFSNHGAELLISTSGSTGEPKAIVLDSNRLWASGIAFARFHGLDQRRLRIWNYLPMSYLGGLYNLALIPLSTGGTVLIDAPFSGGTFLSFWQVVDRYELNTLWLVPTIVNGLLKMSGRLPAELIEKIRSRVNMAFLGTAPIPLETKQRFETVFGIPLLENYGLSETTFISSEELNREAKRLPGTTGRVMPDLELNLLSLSDGAEAADSETSGEIRVRSPWLFRGYLTAGGQVDPALDDEGWFRTGDTGRITDSGELQITGRLRDILKKGGYMVSLVEAEQLAVSYDGVSEAAAVKVPHDFYGESYLLYIVPENPDEKETKSFQEEFERFLHNRLVKYKWPEKVIPIRSLPRTSSGKIQKHLISEASTDLS